MDTNYDAKFEFVLTAASVADNFTKAITEWVYYGEEIECGKLPKLAPLIGKCACTHDISRNFTVHNRLNDNILVVGSCCIRKFKISRAHYNRSHANFLEYANTRVRNDRDQGFINSLYSKLNQYGTLRLSESQVRWLEDMTSVKWRWGVWQKKNLQLGGD